MNDLLGGKVQVLFGTTAVAIEHIRAGKVAEGLEVGWVRRVSDPSPRWTMRALFCGGTTPGDRRMPVRQAVRPSGLATVALLPPASHPAVSPLFFQRGPQHGPNLIAKRG
jgi:hypothetical protein